MKLFLLLSLTIFLILSCQQEKGVEFETQLEKSINEFESRKIYKSLDEDISIYG